MTRTFTSRTCNQRKIQAGPSRQRSIASPLASQPRAKTQLRLQRQQNSHFAKQIARVDVGAKVEPPVAGDGAQNDGFVDIYRYVFWISVGFSDLCCRDCGTPKKREPDAGCPGRARTAQGKKRARRLEKERVR
jgi:hypothetical protein